MTKQCVEAILKRFLSGEGGVVLCPSDDAAMEYIALFRDADRFKIVSVRRGIGHVLKHVETGHQLTFVVLNPRGGKPSRWVCDDENNECEHGK